MVMDYWIATIRAHEINKTIATWMALVIARINALVIKINRCPVCVAVVT
jgi:hypothetical protein